MCSKIRFLYVEFECLHVYRNVNSIERAHVRNVDYNTKREHILVRPDSKYKLHIYKKCLSDFVFYVLGASIV